MIVDQFETMVPQIIFQYSIFSQEPPAAAVLLRRSPRGRPFSVQGFRVQSLGSAFLEASCWTPSELEV